MRKTKREILIEWLYEHPDSTAEEISAGCGVNVSTCGSVLSKASKNSSVATQALRNGETSVRHTLHATPAEAEAEHWKRLDEERRARQAAALKAERRLRKEEEKRAEVEAEDVPPPAPPPAPPPPRTPGAVTLVPLQPPPPPPLPPGVVTTTTTTYTVGTKSITLTEDEALALYVHLARLLERATRPQRG